MFINRNKVAVLLSTYNGRRYLPELLQSLSNQTYSDFTLYVRDDGSSDCTPEIIKKFSLNHPNVQIVESGANMGSKYSFLHLLKNVDSEYYMFCDQDDVWKPDKIQVSVRQLERIDREKPGRPVIVHTDLELVDGNMRTIAASYWEYCRIPVDMPHDYHLLCHFNDITGCAMIFNRAARDISLPYIHLKMPHHVYHDYLIALITAKEGGAIYPVHQTTIWFRRHGGNETNPLSHKTSILMKLNESISYIKEQHRRCEFYNNFKKQSFISFIYYKCKTKYFQVIWKQKQE